MSKPTRKTDPRRRQILLSLLAGASMVPFAAVMGRLSTANAETPRLSEDDPQAQMLNYVHDADANAVASRTAGHYCRNCMHFSEQQDDGSGRCAIFAQGRVKAAGWCAAWFSA